MKKILKIVAVLGILAAGVLITYKFFHQSKAEEVGVMVSEKVKRATIQTTISSTGTLSPMDTVNVGTQVSGDISKIYVDFNSKVKKGQVIAELDRSKLQTALYQAQIAASSAQVDYEHKQAVYNRTKKLAETNSTSAVDLENAEYDMNSAKYSWETRKSEVQQAKLNLSYCIIKSPIDGVVLQRSVDVGQTVAASMNTPTLFILAKDLSKMRVMADVDEADIGFVKTGQSVTFTVDAFQNDTFTGTVESVRLKPTVTSNVVTYSVVISAENPELKLLPGMTATCTIVTAEVKDVISVPVTALKFTPAKGTIFADPKKLSNSAGMAELKGPSLGEETPSFTADGANKKEDKKKMGSKVWMNVNGMAVMRPVKTGLDDGVNVQILNGLDEGDSVVVKQESAAVAAQSSEEATSPFMPGPRKQKK